LNGLLDYFVHATKAKVFFAVPAVVAVVSRC